MRFSDKEAAGLAFGFISFVLIKTVSGKAGDIKATMWIIAILSLAFLIHERLPGMIDYIKRLI